MTPIILFVFIVTLFLASPTELPARSVVIYTSADQIYSEPILKEFEVQTGIKVLAVYDVEATKTTGLMNRLIAEKNRPLADVFWNSEFTQTILLKEEGVLAPYTSAPNDGIVGSVRQNIGETIYRNSDFECEIKGGEALMLAAMMNIQRKTFLSDIADEKETGATTMDIRRIQYMLSGNAKNYQWLTYIIRDMMEGEGISSPDGIEKVLDSLVKMDYVAKHDGGYILTLDTLFLSRRMLLLDTFLTLTSSRIEEKGRVVILGLTVIQAGVHDLLFMDAYDDIVLMDAVSSTMILDYVSHFLDPAGALDGKSKSR
jgi:hypothetical protein